MRPGRCVVITTLMLVLAGAALANAPKTSPRPVPRPISETARQAGSGRSFERAIQNMFRPVVHPTRVVQVASAPVAFRSPRPTPRPDNLRRRSVVAASGMAQSAVPALRVTRRGSVCGVKQIQGQVLAPIPGKLGGCGVAAPVRVTSVSGVALSQAATIDCETAKALNDWVRNGVKPAVGRLGGGVASLKVIAHYSCRTRNNVRGAKISEHGKGHAVDVAGVTLKNGVTLTVLQGWRDPVQSKIIRAMHRSACGPFGTVLGPSSDRYHQDHIHVDTARYRGGPYCK